MYIPGTEGSGVSMAVMEMAELQPNLSDERVPCTWRYYTCCSIPTLAQG